MYLKNTASQKLEVFAFDYSTGAPKTGDAANITAYVNIDDAGYNALGDTSATEVDSTNKKGLYVFDLTQGETNGAKLAFFAKSSTANVSVIAQPRVSFTQPATGILAPTTAGRTLDVSATGEAGVDWANVGSPTTTLALTGTTIATTQQVDVNTIKTQAVTCAAGVTIRADVGAAAAPGAANGMLIGGSNAATTFATLTVTGAVLFSSTFATTGTTTLNALTVTNALTVSGTTTLTGAVSFGSTWTVTGAVTFTAGLTSNITGTLATVTTLTKLPAITANWLTATGIAADAITAAKIADGAIDTATFAAGTTIPRCTLVDTTTVNTDMRGTNNTALAATALSTAQWTNALATLLGGFVFTVPGFVDVNIQYVNDVAVAGDGAPGTEWGPA